MAFAKFASLAELPPGSVLEIFRGDDCYALCNVDGDVRALAGVCPHAGGPLGQGTLDGTLITCPFHAWQFESATGTCMLDDEMRLETYPVRVENGEIFVDVPYA